MGWSGIHISDTSNKSIINHFKAEFNNDRTEVIKIAKVGNVVYGAIKNKVRNETFALIVLISIDNKDYYNLNYNAMDESVGCFNYDCPQSIMKLLSPLEEVKENQYAIEWRKEVNERYNKSKMFSKDNIIIKVNKGIKFNNGIEYFYFKKEGKNLFAIRVDFEGKIIFDRVKKFSFKNYDAKVVSIEEIVNVNTSVLV